VSDSLLISAIIPVRNRSNPRLENCLRSLRWQDLPSERYEILLSDFGSEPQEAQDLKEMAASYGARITRCDTDEIWNRSRALNHGIREALGRYVFCTDADMIFEPNFLSTLLSTQQAKDEDALVVCRCRDLPQSVPEKIWDIEEYPNLLGEAAFRKNWGGTGACQMAVRTFFEEVRGYDEGYKFWGMEDNDMKFRAARYGLKLDWIHEKSSMLHQWHPSDRGKKPLSKLLNDLRFHVSRYKIKKNRKTWGGLP
jgi:glycosyltransferase involved in cell wall biosynthesis